MSWIETNFEDLTLLIYKYKPVARKKLFLKDTDKLPLNYHSCNKSNNHTGGWACGGVALFVNNAVPNRPIITLDTYIQTTSVSIFH